MDKEKLKVGQTLYSLNVGNAARRVEQVLTPVTVTKVGRKYFTCTKEGRRIGTQYKLSDWSENTEYSSDSCLYENPQEFEDEKERRGIGTSLSELFRYGAWSALSLDQLRRIKGITEE